VVSIEPHKHQDTRTKSRLAPNITRASRSYMFLERMLGALAAPVKQRYGAKQWKEADLRPPE
jgi:hypothetical protein